MLRVADIGEGEADQGAHLYHEALATVVVATIVVVAQFAVFPQLMHRDLVPLHGLRSLEAGAHQYHSHHWTLSLPNE